MTRALDQCGDEELARRAAAGSDIAIDSLYDRHAEGVVRYCRAILRDPDDADDAAQEVWVRALRAMRETRGGVTEAFRPWLYTVARNECMDRFRRRARESGTEPSESQLQAAPAVDRVYEAHEELAAAIRDIALLPEPSRSAFALRELAGLDQREVASSLGLPVERAGRLLADARRTLTDRRAGRAMGCEEARHAIAALRVRNVRVRGHIESCLPCRSFASQVRGRRLSSLGIAPVFAVRDFVGRLAPLAGAGHMGGAAAVVGSSALVVAAAVTLALPAPGHPGGADHGDRSIGQAASARSPAAVLSSADSGETGRAALRQRDRDGRARARADDGGRETRARRRSRPGDVRGRPKPASTRESGGAPEPASGPGGDPRPSSGQGPSPVDSVARSVTDTVAVTGQAVTDTAASIGGSAQPVAEAVKEPVRTVTGAAPSLPLPAAGR